MYKHVHLVFNFSIYFIYKTIEHFIIEQDYNGLFRIDKTENIHVFITVMISTDNEKTNSSIS